MSRSIRVGLGFGADVLLLPQYKERLADLDVILFPELMDGGYAALKRGMKPHGINDGFVAILKNASREFSNTIVAGSTFLKAGTARPTNTSLVFSRGKLIHRYDKIHLFKPTGDMTYFTRGVRAGTFSITAGRNRICSGMVICYDLRFPELMRAMALKGMKMLFVPARWPAVRDEAWQSLLKARAIENQIFVVGCNSLDGEGGISYAFNPFGKMVFSNRENGKELLHAFEFDLQELDEARGFHRNLREAVFLRSRFIF
jgi:predicted amidohydrolase